MTTAIKEKKVSDIADEAGRLKCHLGRSLYIVDEFLKGPMCGKCFPCSMGSYEARLRLENISARRGEQADLDVIRLVAERMGELSMCKKGKDIANLLKKLVEDSDGFKAHIADGICPDRECESYIEYRIIPDKCIMCGNCIDACKFGAIYGEKREKMRAGYKPLEIRQRRCTKCGECVKVCPTNAIEIVNIAAELPAGK